MLIRPTSLKKIPGVLLPHQTDPDRVRTKLLQRLNAYQLFVQSMPGQGSTLKAQRLMGGIRMPPHPALSPETAERER